MYVLIIHENLVNRINTRIGFVFNIVKILEIYNNK